MDLLLLLLLSLVSSTLSAAAPSHAYVIVPVADVWSKTTTDPDLLTNDDRETQVLFGERVLIRASRGEWVRIEAIEQPTFRQHNKWEGYPGWVLRSSIGDTPPAPASTVFTGTPLEFVQNAIGAPYFVGADLRK